MIVVDPKDDQIVVVLCVPGRTGVVVLHVLAEVDTDPSVFGEDLAACLVEARRQISLQPAERAAKEGDN